MSDPTNDADLLGRRLFVQSPLEEAKLTLKLSTGIGMTGILAGYDHRAFKLPCAECGAARHYKGFLIELSNGDRTLIGHNCGEKVFGSQWAVHHRRFRRLVDRQELLRRGSKLLAVIPSFLELSATWQPRIEAVMRFWSEFNRVFPIISQHLRTVIDKHDGQLEVREWNQEAGATGAGERPLTRSLGRVAGRGAVQIWAAKRQFDEARAKLATSERILRRGNVDDKSLQEAVTGCADAMDAIVRGAKAHNEVLEFLSPKNLRIIAHWAFLTPTMATETVRGPALRREYIERREELVVEERRIIVPKKNLNAIKRFKAQSLFDKARKAKSLSTLPGSHPKLFTFETKKSTRRVVKVVRHIVDPPNVSHMLRLDLTEAERLIPAL